MGDQQHGGAFGLEHVQGFIPDVIAQTVIKTRKRLVHQHDFGPRCQCAGQCNALLLAARQLVREAVDMAAHADFAQQFFDAGAGSAAVKLEAEGHVLRDAEVRKQGEILKHQTDRPRFRRHVAPVAANQLAIDVDLPRIGRFHPSDHPQCRGFAAARGAQQAGHLPRHHAQADIIDDLLAAKAFGDVTDFKARRGGHGIL